MVVEAVVQLPTESEDERLRIGYELTCMAGQRCATSADRIVFRT